ncbi:hypothetical protein BSL78_21316 [Apostichopus japonicus]|uniref:Uncharacterized protein n=1 Tax=Stichopus japonicus TaxID=307972 RepID=A0A2G8K1K7_STIJA|nr:hypothetical protein BSL78_21316 [Apostichopus japonicus]
MTDLQKRRKRTSCNRFRRPRLHLSLNHHPQLQLIVNLSSTLTNADLRLLSKGLNFCPTPPSFDQAERSQDLTNFFRRIRLREFFLYDPPTEREPFCKKSSWMPPKNRVPVLEAYTQVVSSETNQSNSPLPEHTTTFQEMSDSTLLTDVSHDIIIQASRQRFCSCHPGSTGLHQGSHASSLQQ